MSVRFFDSEPGSLRYRKPGEARITLRGVRIAISNESPARRRASKIAISLSMKSASGSAIRKETLENSDRIFRALADSDFPLVLRSASQILWKGATGPASRGPSVQSSQSRPRRCSISVRFYLDCRRHEDSFHYGLCPDSEFFVFLADLK